MSLTEQSTTNNRSRITFRAGPNHKCPVCGDTSKGCSATVDKLHMCRGIPRPGWRYICDAKDGEFKCYRASGDTRNGSESTDRPAVPDGYWRTRTDDFVNYLRVHHKQHLIKEFLGLPLDVLDVFPEIGFDPQFGRLTFPESDAAGNVVGVSWRDGSGKGMYGGELYPEAHRGLFAPKDWRDHDGTIFVTDGISDTLALTAVGFTAIARSSSGSGIDLLKELFVGIDRPIIVVGDNEPKGAENVRKIVAELIQAGHASVEGKLAPKGYKDVREFLLAQKGPWQNRQRVLLDAMVPLDVGGGENKDDLVPMDFNELRTRFPSRREPIIDGILRRGEVLNFNSHSKVGKSWVAYGVALSVSNGVPWLGRYPTKKGKVLLIDNELHNEELSHRISLVSDAIELPPDNIRILSLRGRLVDYKGLREKLLNHIRSDRYELVIVDSHYKMLPDGISENGNSEMTVVYNVIDSMAMASNAAFWLNHHTTKGDQSGKEVTDVGAGAGAQSRAADTHLVLRAHREDTREHRVFVLDGVVRSFPPLEPVCVQWEHPSLIPTQSYNPHLLKTRISANRQTQRVEGKDSVLSILPNEGDAFSLNEIAKRCSIGKARCQTLLSELVRDGLADSREIERSGNRTVGYFRIAITGRQSV